MRCFDNVGNIFLNGIYQKERLVEDICAVRE